MNKDTIVILISVLSTPVLGALVAQYFGRKKTKEEVKNLNITGEINLGDSWQKYALQQQKDKEELRKEFTEKIESLRNDHNKEIEIMRAEFNEITDAKNIRIKILEDRVQELETEVNKYKNINNTIDLVTETIHNSVSSASEQIKHDMGE